MWKENVVKRHWLLDVSGNVLYDLDLKTDEQTGYKSYQDPETGAKAKLGIDVSLNFRNKSSTEAGERTKNKFVMVRLGYRAYGESGSHLTLDTCCSEQNVKSNSGKQGVQVGDVFFFTGSFSG